MSRPNISEMQQHIAELVERHEIIVSWCRTPTKAWGSRGIYEVQIAPAKSDVSYVAALHEIGHLLGQHQESRDSVVRERWAWRWARKNAHMWTPRMESRRRVFLELSLVNRRRDHAVIACGPSPGTIPTDDLNASNDE